MDANVIAVVQAEEGSLLARLGAVRAFLAVYAPATQVNNHDAIRAPAPSVDERIRITEAREQRYADKVRAIARELVAQSNGRPVSTREIVDYVQSKGIEIRGKSVQNALSALLSRHPEFENFDRQGWTLAVSPKQFEGESPNENEALNGDAASASEADIEGGRTPEMSPSTPSAARDSAS